MKLESTYRPRWSPPRAEILKLLAHIRDGGIQLLNPRFQLAVCLKWQPLARTQFLASILQSLKQSKSIFRSQENRE